MELQLIENKKMSFIGNELQSDQSESRMKPQHCGDVVLTHSATEYK